MEFVRGRDWIIVLGLTLLALLLRWQASRQSLWLDELHTAWVVADDFQAVDVRARQGNSTPLYFGLVWLISKIAGPSAMSLRGLSIGFGTILVPLAYYLLRFWTGSVGAACLTASLIALDSDFIFFASEARPYAMVQFLALTHVAIFWQMLQTPRPVIVAMIWGCIAAILLWTHVTSAWLLCAEFVLLVVTPTGRQIWRHRWFWFGCLIPVAALGLLGPRLAEVLARRENWQLFVPRPTWSGAWDMFPITSYVIVPCLCFAVCWLADVAFFAVGLGSKAERPGEDITANLRHQRLFLVWACCWFVVPMAGAAILAEWDWARVFLRRYLMVVSLALPVSCGVIASLMSKRWLQWAIVLCVLSWGHGATFSQFVQSGYWPLPDRHQDWASAAKCVASRKAPPWPLLLDAGLIETRWLAERSPEQWDVWRNYLLFPLRSIYDTGVPPAWQIPIVAQRDQPIMDDDLIHLDGAAGLWLLTAGNDPLLVNRVLRQLHSGRRVWQARQVDSFGSLELFELHVEAPATEPNVMREFQTE